MNLARHSLGLEPIPILHLRALSTFLLLALAVLAGMPAFGSARCGRDVAAAQAKRGCKRSCSHCKQAPGQTLRAAVGARCCELRAAPPSTPPVDSQQRSARKVQGPQVALLSAPSHSVPAPPAQRLAPSRLAPRVLAVALPLYRPLSR